jgi:hypothetical protein
MTVDILPIQHRGLAVALQLALEAALIRRARGPAPQQPTTSAIALDIRLPNIRSLPVPNSSGRGQGLLLGRRRPALP